MRTPRATDGFTANSGYEKDEVTGESCRSLQGVETAEQPVGAIQEAIEAEGPVTVEPRNYRKDGIEFWNRVRIAPVTDDSGPIIATAPALALRSVPKARSTTENRAVPRV